MRAVFQREEENVQLKKEIWLPRKEVFGRKKLGTDFMRMLPICL